MYGKQTIGSKEKRAQRKEMKINDSHLKTMLVLRMMLSFLMKMQRKSEREEHYYFLPFLTFTAF